MKTTIFLAAALFCSSEAYAERTRLKVRENTPEASKILKENIDVDLNGTVADALQTITKKTGWSLIASSPKLDQRLSLRTKKRPLGEALELVLEAAGMRATLKPGGQLVVRDRDDDDDDDEEETPDHDDADDHDDDDDESSSQPGLHIHIPPVPPVPPVPPLPPGKGRGKNDRIAYGDDLVIKKDEVVDDAVAQGGDLIVEGRVTGDAVALGGDIIVKKGGVVEGDTSAIGGEVHIENGGIIKGNTQRFAGPLGGIMKDLIKRGGKSRSTDVEHKHNDSDSDGMFIVTILLAVLAFILNIMLIAFVPERIERIIKTLDERPMQAGGAGFAMMLGFLPFCLVLVVTIIGIFLVPVAFAAYALIYVFGYASLSVYVGRRLPIWQNRKTVLGAMALGLGALTAVAIIPFIGPLFVIGCTTFAAGAVVISRIGSGPKIIDESLGSL